MGLRDFAREEFLRVDELFGIENSWKRIGTVVCELGFVLFKLVRDEDEEEEGVDGLSELLAEDGGGLDIVSLQ